jgi:hypothetical protein
VAAVVRLDLKRGAGRTLDGGDVVVEAARLPQGRVVGLIWLDDYKDLGPRAPTRKSKPSLRSSARIFRNGQRWAQLFRPDA